MRHAACLPSSGMPSVQTCAKILAAVGQHWQGEAEELRVEREAEAEDARSKPAFI